MNIFVLDQDPVRAAQLQCDKHVVKMVTESAQMLSTVHRVCDGKIEKRLSKANRKLNYWQLDDSRERLLYKAVHVNHPCTLWTKETDSNYIWHYQHFIALCKEYTYRYEKVHACEKLLSEALKQLPRNIPKGNMTNFRLAMKASPECMFPDDPVKSYKLFYKTKEERFVMKWSKRNVPEWFL